MGLLFAYYLSTHLDILRTEARCRLGTSDQSRGTGGQLVHGRVAVDGLLSLLAWHSNTWAMFIWNENEMMMMMMTQYKDIGVYPGWQLGPHCRLSHASRRVGTPSATRRTDYDALH